MSAALAVYLSVWLLFGAAIGHLQPEDEGTAVLTTFDPDGHAHQTVVRPVVDGDGNIWVLSAQWFRSWYDRALNHPVIELQRDGRSRRYQAVPVEDGDLRSVLNHRRDKRDTTANFFYRALFLYAPIKALKLEPIS